VNDRLHPPRGHPRHYLLRALREALRDAAQDLIPRQPGLVLVDFGCGSAPYRPLLEAMCGRYIAVDLPARPGAELMCGDGAVPAVPAGSVDVVLSTQVLEHVPDPAAYLGECRRLLKRGGLLLLSTHGHWPYHPDPIDLWRWTQAGLRRTVEDNGFRVVRMRGVMGLAPTGLQLLQDALVAKIPARLRSPVQLAMQSAIAGLDRLHSESERDQEACVYVVGAIKDGGPA
jgi:SAM-dependent methyltransferase